MQANELRDLVRLGENEQLELKASVPNPDLIARYLASMANTKGGRIAFGVNEPEEFVGVDVDRVRIALEVAQTKLTPKLDVTVETIIMNGRSVVVATVKPSSQLIAASGGYYQRFGDRTQPLSPEEIKSHAMSESSLEKALSELSTAAAAQTKTIDQLREDFAEANSTPKKLGIAAVGAVIGAVAKYVVDLLLS